MSDPSTSNRYHTVTPYLLVPGIDRLSKFIEDAFDGKVELSESREDGSVMHVEMRVGDSIIMMGEPPADYSPLPAGIFLLVDDADARYQAALDAGATSIMEPMDMEHAGFRYGGVRDPHGNVWWPAAPLEDDVS